MIERVRHASKGLENGYIEVYYDNKEFLREAIIELKKVSQCAGDYKEINSRIDDTLNSIEIELIFLHSSKKSWV